MLQNRSMRSIFDVYNKSFKVDPESLSWILYGNIQEVRRFWCTTVELKVNLKTRLSLDAFRQVTKTAPKLEWISMLVRNTQTERLNESSCSITSSFGQTSIEVKVVGNKEICANETAVALSFLNNEQDQRGKEKEKKCRKEERQNKKKIQ